MTANFKYSKRIFTCRRLKQVPGWLSVRWKSYSRFSLSTQRERTIYSRFSIIPIAVCQYNLNTAWVSDLVQKSEQPVKTDCLIYIIADTTNKRALLLYRRVSMMSYLANIFLWLPCQNKSLGPLGKQRPGFVVLLEV